MRALIAILLLGVLLSPAARAGEASWDVAADVELQMRVFTGDAAWLGQDGESTQTSIAATTELRWRDASGRQRASLIPYLRWDGTDSERSLVDLHEAYWAYDGDSVAVLLGANTVFWGVTESVHLVDIINQTDLAGDIDGEEKLGQPMLNVSLQRDWGELSAYVMPGFRERTFPGIDGRLRAPLPVADGQAEYEASAGQDHVDLALRYSHFIGDVDIGLSLFSGTSREPRFEPVDDQQSLVPHYDQIDQAGLALQYTHDAWLWKLETIVRDGYSQTFAAAVGGFEYTFYQVRDSDADIGLLLEYQYDGRDESEPITFADNDIFVGTRLALNDVNDTSVLAGVAYDHRTGETFINVEAERRFAEDWVFEFRARAFSAADPGDTLYWVARDDYVQLQLARYF